MFLWTATSLPYQPYQATFMAACYDICEATVDLKCSNNIRPLVDLVHSPYYSSKSSSLDELMLTDHLNEKSGRHCHT